MVSSTAMPKAMVKMMLVESFRLIPVHPIIPAIISNGRTLGMSEMMTMEAFRNISPAINATIRNAMANPNTMSLAKDPTFKSISRAVPVTSQVNREGARREGGLAIYDLKDSGDIENDADVIILMWAENDDVEASKRLDGLGSYISMKYNVAKNREGERDVKGKFKFYNSRGIFV